MLSNATEPLTPQLTEQLPVRDSLSTEKEADEDASFSGRELATMFVVLLTATATVIVCTLMVVNRGRNANAAADEHDADDIPHFSEFHLKTGPVFGELRTEGAVQRTTKKRAVKVCETRDCKYTRWLINISVNRTMNPCENFHRYVCSGVMEKYPHWFRNDEGRRFMMAYAMTLNNTNLIFQQLQTAKVPVAGMNAHQKAAAFFRECPAIGSTEADLRYLTDFVRDLQLWSVGEPPFDALKLQVEFMVFTYIPFLFTLDVPFDQKRGKPVISMSVSKDFTKWLVKRSEERKDKTYKWTVETALAGVKVMSLENPNNELVRKVIKHEEKAVKLHERYFADGDKVEVFPLRLIGLYWGQANFSKEWIAHLKLYTAAALPGWSLVSITRKDVRFFHDLFGQPGPMSRAELKTFIAWSLTRFMGQLISLFEPAPAHACWSHTYKFFANAVAYPLYATVNKVRVDMVKKMTDTILQAVAKSMNETDWMDGSTRNEAVRKVKTMKRFVAYPPALSSLEGLNAYYAYIYDIKGPFLMDYVNAAGAYAAHNVFKMASSSRAELENTTFILNTIDANGAYAKYANTLYVTAGLMMPPAFSLGAPSEVNFGAIGRVVVHELMHAFTPDDRGIDANGRVRNWWTTRSDAEYNKRVECLRTSIERAMGMRRSSLENEYLSDMMGERSLFRAYKRASKEGGLSLGDVGNFTADQVFYIAGCLLYCGDAEPGRGHPPMYHRCNVPLINSPQFAKAFSCPKNSPMNPEEKCAFW